MGVWLSANGRLEIKPPADDNLIREFVEFIGSTCPKGYREDEIFYCTWFFDAENRLVSHAGKFAEPDIWYEHLKANFFEARGYELVGDPQISGEGDADFWKIDHEKCQEYKQWKERIKEKGWA